MSPSSGPYTRSFCAGILAVLFIIVAARADAHPLGNFTINHLAKIDVQRNLHIRYVLDIAEIPTFQIMRERTPAGNWSSAAMQSWADSEVAIVQSGLHIIADGTPLALSSSGAHARLRPGAGGLPILYWVDDFHAALAAGRAHHLEINDRVYEARRIGWKDIIVAPQTEPTHELLVYPSALIASPRTITTATFAVDARGKIAGIRRDSTPIVQQQSTTSIVRQTALSEMFLRANQGPLWILITVLAAFGFGALHAIEPGHGKALLAFTLVGSRATRNQAVILAASLTFAHTIGVLLLGVVLFFVAGFVPESIYPWITLVSGVIIVIVGGRALARYLRGARPFAHSHAHAHPNAQPHDHVHEHGFGSSHDHNHEVAHDHAHDHARVDQLTHTHGGTTHTHIVPGEKPLNFGSAVWAAMSGGIAPCPAAIILLIAAVNSHRIAYGLMLILIFGLGLAAVLTGLGMAVVHGAAWIARNERYERYVRFGPLASAALISIIGAILLGQGFVQVGAHTNVILVALLALTAIAGYAFSAHSHRPHAVQPA